MTQHNHLENLVQLLLKIERLIEYEQIARISHSVGYILVVEAGNWLQVAFHSENKNRFGIAS